VHDVSDMFLICFRYVSDMFLIDISCTISSVNLHFSCGILYKMKKTGRDNMPKPGVWTHKTVSTIDTSQHSAKINL
jgi:hypothetical protein